MPNTPIYALPYQTVDDPPNGPILGEDLAERIETVLSGGTSPLAVGGVSASGNLTVTGNVGVGGSVTATGRVVGQTTICRVRLTDVFSIANGGFGTVIEWDEETEDTGSFWSSGNPGQLILPYTGWYSVKPWVQYAANANGVRDLHVLLNGAPEWEDRRTPATGSGQATACSTDADVRGTAGQAVSIRALQNSGGPLNLQPGGRCVIRYVGP